MKTFLKLFLLVVALLSADAAPTAAVNESLDAMIADYYFKDCVPGTTNVIPLANGATEYVCTHKEKHYHDGPAQHKFGTNLFVSTNDGTVNVQIGGNGMGVSVTVYEFQFAASVDSAWHTSRAIVYPSQKTFDNVDNLPKGLQ